MPRTPAKFTQADIHRTLRAVQQSGVDMQVKLLPDGSILISKEHVADTALDAKAEFRL